MCRTVARASEPVNNSSSQRSAKWVSCPAVGGVGGLGAGVGPEGWGTGDTG